MHRYLHLELEAHMQSFGAAQRWPGLDPQDIASMPAGVSPGLAMLPGRPMLTGIFANALGYERSEGDRLQALSERVRFAATIARPGRLHSDFQTTQIYADDRGWTTRGRVEGRRGGAKTYESAHVRRVRSWADAHVFVAARLLDGEGETTEQLAEALQRPERPLFLGRKAHLPAAPIFRSIVRAASAHEAIQGLALLPLGTVWDRGEGPDDAPIAERDDRGWRANVYQGSYRMHFDADGIVGEEDL